jgi:hypothetical protein
MEMPPNATRSYFWMQILGSPIIWGMNAVLALLLWGDVIAKTFPVTDDYFRYLAPLTALSWQWKVIITLVVNIVLLLEVSLRTVHKGERQRDEYRIKLQEIEQARPRIVLCRHDAEYVEPVHIQAIGNVANVVSFIKVRFVNTPMGPPFPNSVAHDVRAKIRFFEPIPGGRLLLAIDGTWADNNQPSTRHWQRRRGDLLKVQFGIEEEHSLDIAFRDDETGELYAFNNDNYGYPQMKEPEYLLAGQHFLVRISLLGPWIDEGFEFLISNDSVGTKITASLSLPGPVRRQG